MDLALLALAVLLIAFLYSSVGHAGASGYIAVMALFGIAPEIVKPTALVLNILVATIGTIQFARSGHFSWSLFWPFAALAVPCAFAGGALALPATAFKLVVGLVLWFAAARLLAKPGASDDARPPARVASLAAGGVLGFVAGLTGTGGGIFLTPLVLLRHWATTRTATAITAPFVLVNSLAGLAGHWSAAREIPALAAPLLAAAALGGTAGSYYGSRRFVPAVIKRLLAVVLVIAGAKLVFGW